MSYNTDINIIGSIPDYHLIYLALPLLIDSPEKLEDILVSNNEFNFRTEKSRKRFLAVLNSALINEHTQINYLVSRLLDHNKADEKSLSIILFWLLSMNNKLFFELNKDVFLKNYFGGRAELSKQTIIAYIKDLASRDDDLKGKWSEITIDTLASKYLTILKKLHLLEGSLKKKFVFIRITDEMLAVFVNLQSFLDKRKANFLEDEFLEFSFISKENILERLKKIGKKDWIKMNYTGTTLKVEPVFETNTIIDGIYRRA